MHSGLSLHLKFSLYNQMQQKAYFILPIQDIHYILWHTVWLFSISMNSYSLEGLKLTSSLLNTAHLRLDGAIDFNIQILAALYKASKLNTIYSP